MFSLLLFAFAQDYKLESDEALLYHLASAQSQVMIATPTLHDPLLAQTLNSLATRGVAVFILTSASSVEAASSYAASLDLVGTKIHLAEVPESFAIVDIKDAVLLKGFAKLDLKILSQNPELIKQYTRSFLDSWQQSLPYESFVTRYAIIEDSIQMLEALEQGGF